MFYITLNSCICFFGESNEKVVTNINLIQKISGPLYTSGHKRSPTDADFKNNSGFRELFAREGELNRSQARERVAQKEIAQLKADLDYERTNNGRTKLDLEKQALKKACKHHKTKAETLAIQLDESKLGTYKIFCMQFRLRLQPMVLNFVCSRGVKADPAGICA